MLGPDDIRRGVKIDQLTTSRIDAAEAETDVVAFRVDEVEIYEALERRLEQRRIVEARRLECARRMPSFDGKCLVCWRDSALERLQTAALSISTARGLASLLLNCGRGWLLQFLPLNFAECIGQSLASPS